MKFSCQKIGLIRLVCRRIGTAGISAALLCCGCGPFHGGPFAREPYYAWGLYNVSDRYLGRDTIVTYHQSGQDYIAVSGVVRPSGRATQSPGFDPIPEMVHVHWVYEDNGEAHDADVAISGHIPDEQRFSGTIWFEIGTDGVRLTPENKAQAQARADREAEEGEKLMKQSSH